MLCHPCDGIVCVPARQRQQATQSKGHAPPFPVPVGSPPCSMKPAKPVCQRRRRAGASAVAQNVAMRWRICARGSTFDVAMEDGVVVVVARSEREEVFAGFGRTVAVELHLYVPQGRVQRHCHPARPPASAACCGRRVALSAASAACCGRRVALSAAPFRLDLPAF